MEIRLLVMFPAVPRYLSATRRYSEEEGRLYLRTGRLRPSGQSKAFLLERLADCLVTGGNLAKGSTRSQENA